MSEIPRLADIRITNEMLVDSPDLMGQIQRQQADAFIAGQRAELAAIAGDYTAWMMFPPTPHDDPAEWAPYWSRLTDVVADADQREAVVADWLTDQGQV